MKYLYRFAFGLLLGVLMGLALEARAQGDHECQGGHNCNDDGSDVVIDSSGTVKGGSSWGLGVGGPGDVDISGCIGSTQWGGFTVFRQKLVRDETCVGFQFLEAGKYKLAAMHFCNDKDTLEEFANEAECETAHDFTPPSGVAGVIRSPDETYELAQQQEQEIEYLQEEQASLVGRIDQLTQQIERAPSRQPIDDGAERRAKARAALKGDEDDG